MSSGAWRGWSEYSVVNVRSRAKRPPTAAIAGGQLNLGRVAHEPVVGQQPGASCDGLDVAARRHLVGDGMTAAVGDQEVLRTRKPTLP